MHEDTDLEFELHAYVDGDLDEESMARVEAHLRGNREAAAKVHDYLRQKDDLRAIARQMTPLDESPDLIELQRGLAKRLTRRSTPAWRRPMSVAVLFLLGWLSHTLYAPLAQVPAFANEVVQAHLLTSGDVSEIPPISPERVSKLFSRIGEIEHVPDLSAFGFEPIGAQLLPSGEGAVLHVPYRDQSGVLVSYFLLHDDNDAELPRHMLHRNGVTMVYWQHHHSRYALAAPMPDDHISQIATFLDSAQGMLQESIR